MSAIAGELLLGELADAVPASRRAVRDRLSRTHEDLLDDAASVVTELVTNAVLHGTPPALLRVLDAGDQVRLEVQDCGSDLPVLAQQSTSAMTGRGLALVARLAHRWGVNPIMGGSGKVVWAELTPRAPGGDGVDSEPELDVDLDALLAAFPDDGLEQTCTISLGSVPTELMLEAKSSIENLVREFTLEAAAARSNGQGAGQGAVPVELAELVATVVHGFAAARDAIKRQALAAARRGDPEVQLTLTLPASAADAGEQYLAALDEADRYARNARLLSLETSPVHKVFRRWYVQRIVDELRAAAAGRSAAPATTFRDELAAALTRVAPLEAQAARLQALQQVTADLTAAATVERIATTVARSATTVLGAHSAHVYLVDGDLFRSAADDGTFDPRVGAQYATFPISLQTPAAEALHCGHVVVVRGRGELIRRYPTLADAYANELSLLVAPLTVGEHRIGVLSATFSGAARVEEQTQRLFLTTLADVTAQALERAQATSAAAQATERLAFLADASMVLSSTLDHRQVLEAIAELVVPRMADWCSIQLVEHGQLLPVAIAHVDPDKVRWAWELTGTYPTDMAAQTGAPQVLRSGVSEMYADIPEALLEAAAVDAEHLRVIKELQIRSGLTVPLTGRTGVLGVVTMIMSAESGRRYDEADVTLAEDLARRAALAVENAEAYREQSGRLASVTRVAEAAQHAILAQPPSRIGPVHLAARYVSAAAEALIGGDLYEVVRRPGAVRLLIGDVRGKGLEAVRTATGALGEFRAAAADLDALDDVATQVDRRLRDYLGDEDFVTAVMAEVRDDGSYDLACCGHPTPLLITGHSITAAPVTPTLPLGLGARPTLSRGRLATGDRLLLFTDGLVEARDPDRHFVDLEHVVQPLGSGDDLGAALDDVLAALRVAVGGALGDDLALLAVEWQPAPA